MGSCPTSPYEVRSSPFSYQLMLLLSKHSWKDGMLYVQTWSISHHAVTCHVGSVEDSNVRGTLIETVILVEFRRVYFDGGLDVKTAVGRNYLIYIFFTPLDRGTSTSICFGIAIPWFFNITYCFQSLFLNKFTRKKNRGMTSLCCYSFTIQLATKL